jgi:hypothetical protein
MSALSPVHSAVSYCKDRAASREYVLYRKTELTLSLSAEIWPSTSPLLLCLENLLTSLWLMHELALAVRKAELATSAGRSAGLQLFLLFSAFTDFFSPPLPSFSWSNFPFGLIPTAAAHYLAFPSPFIIYIYIFRDVCHLCLVLHLRLNEYR